MRILGNIHVAEAEYVELYYGVREIYLLKLPSCPVEHSEERERALCS